MKDKTTRQKSDTLIFTWGNLSRGDDALGPVLYDQLIRLSPDNVDLLTDFQLQIEHVMDIENRQRVLFIDASVSANKPYDFSRVEAFEDSSYTSHAMTPQALLATYQRTIQKTAPACYLLSIRGYQFELGQPLSSQAEINLAQAMLFIREWLKQDS